MKSKRSDRLKEILKPFLAWDKPRFSYKNKNSNIWQKKIFHFNGAGDYLEELEADKDLIDFIVYENGKFLFLCNTRANAFEYR